MKKENTTPPKVFEGFEALSKSLLGPSSNVDDEIPYVDPEEFMSKEEEDEEEESYTIEKESVKSSKSDKDKTATKTVEEEDEEEEEEDEEEAEEEVEKPGNGDLDEDSEIELEMASFLKERLSDELGWEVDEEGEFSSIKDVVDYMKKLVEENSKPAYYSEEIKRLDEYVKNGGSIDRYFREVYGGASSIDYDSIDLSKESVQKSVVRELLKIKGYSEDKINRAIERYEEKETLEEEAEEAVELLKEYKKEQEKKLLEQQEKHAESIKKQQQKFFSDVTNSVKSLDNIRGIKISNKEKEELLDYIFRPDSEGLTKYQRDYMSDIKNLIESAFFTKRGDFLIEEAKKKGSSDAYKDFHQRMKTSKGKRSKNSGGQEGVSKSDILSSISRTLLKKV